MSTSETRIEIPTAKGPVKEHSYIVKLKPGTDKREHLNYIDTRILDRVGGECKVTHPSWDPKFFNGYAGTFTGAALEALRHLPDIEYIEPDQIGSIGSTVTQTNAPWGLARLSQSEPLVGISTDLNFTYTYDATAGGGVDVYCFDTGVRVIHNDFSWRAIWGANFVANSADTDINGHGTHCAGCAVGTRFGAAKAARVIAVKVLDDHGNGTASDVISGLDWTLANGQMIGRPYVISMSIAFNYCESLNNAANMATSWGAHVIVMAGYTNVDAGSRSPSGAAQVITVGASDIGDARWADSNWGSSVDIFAAGVDVISCGIASPSSTATMSGVSMATAYVAGLVAYLIGRDGNMPPAAMKAKLKAMSTWDALSGIPQGTINALARNDH